MKGTLTSRQRAFETRPITSLSWAVLRRMGEMPLIHGCLELAKSLLLDVSHKITFESGSVRSDELEGELRAQIEPHWGTLLRHALSCLDFGCAAFELVYQVDSTYGTRLVGINPLDASFVRWVSADEQVDKIFLDTTRQDTLLEKGSFLWFSFSPTEESDSWGASFLEPVWPFWQALTYAITYGTKWMEQHAPCYIAMDEEKVSFKESMGDSGIGPLQDWICYLEKMLVWSFFVPESALYTESKIPLHEHVGNFLQLMLKLRAYLEEQLTRQLVVPLARSMGFEYTSPRIYISTPSTEQISAFYESVEGVLLDAPKKSDVDFAQQVGLEGR